MEHAADLLCGIGDALACAGEHGTLDLLVAEAGKHGDDDKDQRRNQQGQLAPKRLLREEGRHYGISELPIRSVIFVTAQRLPRCAGSHRERQGFVRRRNDSMVPGAIV